MKSIFVSFLLFAFIGCGYADEDKIGPSEFAVYEAVLSDPTYLQPNVLLLVFDDLTSTSFGPKATDEQVAMLKAELGADDALLQEFTRKNQKQYQLPKKFRFLLDVDTATITPKEKEQLFKGGERGWKLFYRKYPNSVGIITVSRVAFSKSQDLALVYVGNQRGFVNGHGVYHLLQWKNNRWVEIKECIAWLS